MMAARMDGRLAELLVVSSVNDRNVGVRARDPENR
jgi:hypothetical protein